MPRATDFIRFLTFSSILLQRFCVIFDWSYSWINRFRLKYNPTEKHIGVTFPGAILIKFEELVFTSSSISSTAEHCHLPFFSGDMVIWKSFPDLIVIVILISCNLLYNRKIIITDDFSLHPRQTWDSNIVWILPGSWLRWWWLTHFPFPFVVEKVIVDFTAFTFLAFDAYIMYRSLVGKMSWVINRVN